MRKLLDGLGQDRAEEQRTRPFTRREIVYWWESRRFAYNFRVGVVGIAAWISIWIFASMAVKPGVDFEEPLGMIIGPFFWAFMANICYTAGWLLDVTQYIGAPRRRLFKIGLSFSIFLHRPTRIVGDRRVAHNCCNRSENGLTEVYG